MGLGHLRIRQVEQEATNMHSQIQPRRCFDFDEQLGF